MIIKRHLYQLKVRLFLRKVIAMIMINKQEIMYLLNNFTYLRPQLLNIHQDQLD